MPFHLISDFKPSGDQPQAIKELSEGILRGDKYQTLLGVTGSGKTFTISNVIAQFDKPVLIMSESKPIIMQIVEMLKSNPELQLSVEGHTDNVGSRKSNKTLSEERSKSVVTAIVSGGIGAKRLSAFGHGQEKLIADNKTEEGRAKNRRVELVKK